LTFLHYFIIICLGKGLLWEACGSKPELIKGKYYLFCLHYVFIFTKAFREKTNAIPQ
jgi:hypothetical protein